MRIFHSLKASQHVILNAILFAISMPAHAQIGENATTLLGQISTWLRGLGIVIITIALMVVGFRMAFQAAEWKDVAPVFWGGVLVGGAGAIAGVIMGS